MQKKKYRKISIMFKRGNHFIYIFLKFTYVFNSLAY